MSEWKDARNVLLEGVYDTMLKRRGEMSFEVLEYAQGTWKDVLGQRVIIPVEAYRDHVCNGENCICKVININNEA